MSRNKSFWDNRPTLVTGATGLLGGWLVKRLLSLGADVICVIRDCVPQSELIRSGSIDRVKVVRGDVCDRVFLERVLGEYEIDTVMHLAAQTIVGIANRNPISTLHPYDVSKSCADLIAQAYGHTYNLPVAITRCGNFYGGGDLNWNRIIPGTIRSILQREGPVVRSDGSYIRDYIYVEDGAAAYMLLAEQLATNSSLYGQAFNFSNETQVTVLDLVTKIVDLMGGVLDPIVQNQASNEIQHQFLDATKAKEVLGWTPDFTLDRGLEKTINWYRNFLECSSSHLEYSDLETLPLSNLSIQQTVNN